MLALYGPRWQTKLARAVPVNPRTVRRWLAGERKIHPAIAERIRGLLAEKVAEMEPILSKNVKEVATAATRHLT